MKFLDGSWFALGTVDFLGRWPEEALDVLGEKLNQVASEGEEGVFDWKFELNLFLESFNA